MNEIGMWIAFILGIILLLALATGVIYLGTYLLEHYRIAFLTILGTVVLVGGIALEVRRLNRLPSIDNPEASV